jgi:hypothetical protein
MKKWGKEKELADAFFLSLSLLWRGKCIFGLFGERN